MFHKKSTYLGFYANWLVQIPIAFTFILLFCIIVLLYVELCFYVDALVCDLRGLTFELNAEMIANLKAKSSQKPNHSEQEIDLFFKKIITLHKDMLK